MDLDKRIEVKPIDILEVLKENEELKVFSEEYKKANEILSNKLLGLQNQWEDEVFALKKIVISRDNAIENIYRLSDKKRIKYELDLQESLKAYDLKHSASLGNLISEIDKFRKNNKVLSRLNFEIRKELLSIKSKWWFRLLIKLKIYEQ